jgi:hypothetical protein
MNSFQKLTDMTELADVISEMSKKYYKCFVCIENPQTGEQTYSRYQEYDHDKKAFIFISDGNALYIPFDTELDIYVPKLRRGLYNINGLCMYVRQIPARQYKRGLNPDNFLICPLYKYIFGGTHINEFYNWCKDVLSTPQKNCTLDDAIDALVGHEDKNIKPIPAIAINRDFALMHSATGISVDDGYDLWYHASFVGKVFPENRVIKVHNPVFFQEILDTQIKWCPNYMVN